MREFVIMADVNADTTPEFVELENIAIMPQYYHFNDGVIYGDEQKSRKLCERFQKCSACYCRLWERGVGLEKLAVAV